MAATPTVVKPPEKRSLGLPKKNRRNRLSRMLGESDTEDSAIIPKNAQPYNVNHSGVKDSGSAEKINPKTGPELPVYANGDQEPLLSPVVALVAPDVTPDALVEIDPSDVPHPPVEKIEEPEVSRSVDGNKNRTALDTILGKPPPLKPENPARPLESPAGPAPTPQSAPHLDVEAMLHRMQLQNTPQISLEESEEGEPIISSGYDVIAAGMTAGIPMPEPKHNPNGTTKMVENTRKFYSR
jgi:hypothetical protein